MRGVRGRKGDWRGQSAGVGIPPPVDWGLCGEEWHYDMNVARPVLCY